MPNALVDYYRTQVPNDPRSDDEVLLDYVNQYGLDKLNAYPGVADDYKRVDLAIRKGTAPSLFGEAGRALARGTDQFQGQLYSTAGLVGDLVGSPALGKWGQAGYERNLQEAAKNPATIQSPGEISGVGDAARFVTGLVGEQVPQIGLAFGAAALTGGLGTALAGPAIAGEGAAAVAQAANIARMARLGQMAGLGATGFTQSQNRGELLRTPGVDPESVAPTALGVGAAGAFLQSIPELQFLDKATGRATHLLPDLIPAKVLNPITRHLPDSTFGEYLGRVLHNVPEQVILQGGTGVLQELTTMAGELYANRDNPNFQITQQELAARLGQSALAGSIMGAGMGALESIPNHQKIPASVDALAPSTVTPETPTTDQPAASVSNPVSDHLGADASPSEQQQELDPMFLAAMQRAKITRAEVETDTNPTEAQKEAGNYKKGRVNIQGLDIAIENPAGSTREGTDKNGEPWSVTMPATYGYVEGVKGKDGDAVDVYIGPDPTSKKVFVVDQINPETDRFDETKSMLGFPDKQTAIAAYDAAFSDGKGPERRNAVTETSIDGFKAWLKDGDQKKPFAESKSVPLKIESMFPVGSAVDYRDPFSFQNNFNGGNERKKAEVTGFRTDPTTGDVFLIINGGKTPQDFVSFRNDLKRVGAESKGGENTNGQNETNAQAQEKGQQELLAQPAAATERLAQSPSVAAFNPAEHTENEQILQAVIDKYRRQLEQKAVRQDKARTKELERNTKVLQDVIDSERTRLEKEKAAAEVPAVAEPALPEPTKPEPTVGLNLDAVDFDNAALSKIATNKGADGRTAEKAFFLTKDTGFSQPLAERLVSDAKGDQGKKSDTRRYVFFENEDGAIVGHPIWYTNDSSRGGKIYRVAGTTLEKFMAEGNTPVASFRLKEPVSATDKANVIRYDDYRHFEKELAGPAIERQGAADRTANAVGEKMQARGFDEAGNVLEAQNEPAAEHEEDPIVTFQNALYEELGGEQGLRDLTHDDLRDALSEVAKSEPGAYLAVSRELLKDKSVQEQLWAKDRKDQRALVHEIMTGAVYDRIKKALQNQPAGDQAVGSGAGRIGDSNLLLFSKPSIEGQRYHATTDEIKGRFNSIVEAAQERGVTVDIVKAIGREIGSFAGKERKITLALFDADNPTPENLRLLLHEAAHDVTRGLPENVRTAIHQAVESFTDEQLQIENSSDPRIRASNPEGLSRPVLTEERLAEHLALQGLDRPTSNSLAAQAFRFLKQLYYNVALALQKVMGREPSQELAMAYVRNRFDSATAGEPIGIFRFLIPPVQTQAHPQTLFSTPGGLNRIGERLDPKVIVETRVAALNERIDLEKKIAEELARVPAAVAAAADDGLPVLDWWRRMTRFDNPKLLIEAERQHIDPTTNLRIGPNPDVRIDDFKAEQNRQVAVREALADISQQWSKVTARVSDLAEESRAFEAKRKAKADAYHELTNKPRLPMSPEDEAKFKAKLDRLQDDAKALAAKRDEADAQQAAAEAVVGLYRQKVIELSGPLGAHKAFAFGHGEELLVPDRVDATEPGDGFSVLKIKYDSHGQLTKPSEMIAAAEKMGAWLEAREQSGKTDGTYWQVKVMQEEILKNSISTDLRKYDGTISGLATASPAEQAKGLSTPLWRQVGQLLNRFTDQSKFLRSILDPMFNLVTRYKHEAANTIGIDPEFYRTNFYNRAVNFLESRRDIVEAFPTSFRRQMDTAMADFRRRIMEQKSLAVAVGQKADVFFGALRKHLEAEWEISQFIQKHTVKEGNVYVRDPRLKADRLHIQLGVMTLPRTISKTFDALWNVMKSEPRNWAAAAEVFKHAGEMYEQLGPDQLWSSIRNLFTDKDGIIQRNLVQALAEDTGTFSPFPAPRLEDGTQPEANPAHARDAYRQSGGNVVNMLERMFDLHGGTGDRATYIQEGLAVFAKYFGEMRRLREQIDPDGMAMPKDFRSMIPGLMIHARELEHWPAQWHEPMSFESDRLPRVVERVAAQVAFGNQNERLEKSYSNAVREYNQEVKKLTSAEEMVAQTVPSTDAKVREAALAKAVGGTSELKRLRKLQELGKLVDGGGSIRSQMVDYFTSKNSSLHPIRFLQNLTSLFSQLMINQPGSALGQFAELFTPFITFGPSEQAARMVMRNVTGLAKDLAGGLVNSFGDVLKRQDDYYLRAQQLGVRDYDAVKRVKDILNEPGHPQESGASSALRKFRSVLNVPLGSGTQFTGLRLLAPFHQVNLALHMVSTVNFWKEVDSMVARGVKWAKENPASFVPSLADDPISKWADRLGYGAAGKDAFVRTFQHALDDWGLDYHKLVREGLRNQTAGKPLLSDHTLTRLQGMWIKEATTESNIATMTSAAFNNSVLKFMLPLLGWGWRRSRKVTELRYDEKDQATYGAFAKGLAGLAVLGAGGLAVSGLVDLYNEDLQRKRRNLRRLTPDQSGGNIALAILEHSARVGTFGILGDLANEAVNVGTGSGANRGVSMDNRVVFVNSLLGMIRASSAFANQGFQADYMNVVRPMLFSMGGNGALQYLQMANTLFDLDNAESRAVRRTNVSNWLRVMGREIGYEVNTDTGGYSSPTPLTPLITKMQLAALADDPEGFREARMDAITKAREEGKPNAMEYVARTFSSRHPLRTVFRTPLTELQYQQLLTALPDDGRLAVSEAVNLFNRYGASMGVMPFDGKPIGGGRGGNRATRSADDLEALFQTARERAAAF